MTRKGFANDLEFPSQLADAATLEAAFEGQFRPCFERLGIRTVGELRQVPMNRLPSLEFFELNAWLLRCWWFR